MRPHITPFDPCDGVAPPACMGQHVAGLCAWRGASVIPCLCVGAVAMCPIPCMCRFGRNVFSTTCSLFMNQRRTLFIRYDMAYDYPQLVYYFQRAHL